MPPQPTLKSPRPRKTNPVIKTKGAVRAKSGCYTCRIRRKVRPVVPYSNLSHPPHLLLRLCQKCDEKRINNEDGPCETCIRLKLECLGFGAKRPDWLRVRCHMLILYRLSPPTPGR